MDKLLVWKEQIARLDAKLKPIANRPIKFTDWAWILNPKSRPNPLEEAGIKTETEQFLAEIIAAYPVGDDDVRKAIRKLFEDHSSFTWAATLPYEPVTEATFRAHLILFSIKDHEQDTRDAIVTLHSLCEKAGSAGIKMGPILKEVAELSSEVNKYGMGSTRSLLLGVLPATGK